MAGAIQVSEGMTFDQLDGFLSQGLVTSYDQLMTPPVAQVAVPPQTFPGAVAPATPNLLTSITSILSSGAQAYGAYATAAAARKPKPQGPMMPPGYNPYAMGPTVAPTGTGLTGTQIALIVGGGVLLLGVGALLVFRK
jgi:hypothetical protein